MSSSLSFPCLIRGFAAGIVLWGAVLTFPAVAPAADFLDIRDHWRRLESPHFELYSAASVDASRTLLRNLETLHALFLGQFHLAERRPVESTVYYFSTDRALQPYKPDLYGKKRDLAAYYQNSPDRAVIALSDEYELKQTQAIIFHEYIHHLFRVTEQDPPLWYNEGMAELFSSIEVQRDSLILGEALPGHVVALRTGKLLPLAVLFAVDPKSQIYTQGNHTGMFYSESWTLMHYLFFGQNKLARKEVDQFLRYACTESGRLSPPELRAVFEQKVGMSYAAMEAQLESYVHSGRYGRGKVPLPKIAPPELYPQRAVPGEEMSQRLAELALRVNQDPRAKLWLLDLLTKEPQNLRALETLGQCALQEGDAAEARARWTQAIAAGSRNPALFQELGRMETQRWFSQFDYYFRLPAAKTEELRHLLHLSIDCAPSQSAAYEQLAWVEAAAPQPDIPAVNLIQAHFTLTNDKPRTLLALAMIRARLGDKEGALDLLASVRHMNPSPATEQAVRYVTARLSNAALVDETEQESRPQRIEIEVETPLPPVRPNQ